MTQNTEQDRAEFEDGAWYWVEKEGWHDEPPEAAPAMYRANANAWYSFRFGGIPTRELKVLEPCVRHEQAARRAPAVPQGWKMVPVDPDNKMRRAAQKAEMDHSPHSEWLEDSYPDVARVWHAMLAAAPQPPEAIVNHSLTVDLKDAAPVQLPEPVGVAHTGQLDNIKDGYAYVYPVGSVGAGCKLYTEQQIRQILSTLQK